MDNLIPKTDKEAWLIYPKINWLYVTHRVLEYQKINWFPFPIKNTTNTVLSDYSIDQHILSSGTGNVYIEGILKSNTKRNKIDTVLHKGQIVEEIHYSEDNEGNIAVRDEPPSGNIELLVQSIVAWHFDKFCGIISFEYDSDMILAVRLKPHDKAETFYPQYILDNMENLYYKKKWIKPKVFV
jgi:hypothetical protein